MKYFAMMICYIFMCVFDTGVLIGLYRVLGEGRSYWWILLAVLMLMGSAPSLVFKVFEQKPQQPGRGE